MVLSQKLLRLEKIANKLGYQIVPGKDNTLIPAEKTITINMRQKLIKRVWNTAHEIGHALTLTRCMNEVGMRALTGAPYEWPCLESELRAWHEADKLMRRLSVYSNEYLRYKHSCIRSYYCLLKQN